MRGMAVSPGAGRTAGMLRSRTLALPLAAALLLLAGCTDVQEAVAGPDPEPTARQLAEALTAQDLTGAPVGGAERA